MSLFSLLGVLSPAHIRFFTLFSRARRVGQDGYGNVYYERAARTGYAHTRRFVVYHGAPDPSRVPAEWHGWLHHQTDALPTSPTAPGYRRTWQKPHLPNMTGTDAAYTPPGHIRKGAKRASATGDYIAWTPDQPASYAPPPSVAAPVSSPSSTKPDSHETLAS